MHKEAELHANRRKDTCGISSSVLTEASEIERGARKSEETKFWSQAAGIHEVRMHSSDTRLESDSSTFWGTFAKH